MTEKKPDRLRKNYGADRRKLTKSSAFTSLKQAVFHSITDQLHPTVQLQLAHQIGSVALHGAPSQKSSDHNFNRRLWNDLFQGI
jgi:hypothetical protein